MGLRGSFFSGSHSYSQMVPGTAVMTKASPFVCLVIDAGLSSGTSVGSVGWSPHMPSLCDLDFLKAWWTVRASIQKRARPKRYRLALEVIQNPFAVV